MEKRPKKTPVTHATTEATDETTETETGTIRLPSGFVATLEQYTVISAGFTPGRSVVVEAVAGSGKTTTMAQYVKKLVTDRGRDVPRVLFMYFNKAPKEEMIEKLKKLGVESPATVKTFSAMGVHWTQKVRPRWNSFGETLSSSEEETRKTQVWRDMAAYFRPLVPWSEIVLDTEAAPHGKKVALHDGHFRRLHDSVSGVWKRELLVSPTELGAAWRRRNPEGTLEKWTKYVSDVIRPIAALQGLPDTLEFPMPGPDANPPFPSKSLKRVTFVNVLASVVFPWVADHEEDSAPWMKSVNKYGDWGRMYLSWTLWGSLATDVAPETCLPYDVIVLDEAQDCQLVDVQWARAAQTLHNRQVFWVGDPNQSMNKWRKCVNVFAMDLIKSSSRIITMTRTFRCPAIHIEFIKARIPGLPIVSEKPGGVLRTQNEYFNPTEAAEAFVRGNTILVQARTNVAVLRMALTYLRHQNTRARAVVKGRSSDLLNKAMKKYDEFWRRNPFGVRDDEDEDEDDDEEPDEEEEEADVTEPSNKPPSQLEKDSVDRVLRMIRAEGFSPEELRELTHKKYLTQSRTEDGGPLLKLGVFFSTTHSLKGLEAEFVIVNHDFLKHLEKTRTKESENIAYTALSRSQHTLVVLGGK